MRYVLAVAVLISGVAVGQELPADTNDIETLKVEQAKALAESKDELLILNGLTTLDAATAKALAEFKGDGLSLYGLTTLSDEAAKALRANPEIELPDVFKRLPPGAG